MQRNLKIKLCRFGRKHAPIYRLGVLPAFRHPSRQFAIEFIGNYNPKTKELNVDKAKLDSFIALNIAMSDTVKQLLIKNNLLTSN